MNNILIISISISIAGLSVLWRKILIDFPSLETCLKTKLGAMGHVLICGFCYTYWLSLASVLVFGPSTTLSSHHFFSHYNLGTELLLIGVSWMFIAFIAQTLRFIFIILQQLLVYFLHVLNVNLEHKH